MALLVPFGVPAWSRLDAGQRPTPSPLVTQPPDRAGRLFQVQCGICHGNDGRGAERGPDIVATRRALTRPVEEIERIIREGVPAGGMPPSPLPDDDIRMLARYMRTLAESAREPRTVRRVRLGLRDGQIPVTEPSVRGTLTCPSVVGATNWMSPAFNPDTGLYYVMPLARCSIFLKSGRSFEPGESFYGGSTQNVPGEPGEKYLRAIDVQTGKIAWEYPQIGTSGTWGGVLSTATGLVFFGEDGGAFAAVDARSGKLLWHFPANTTWRGSPRAYSADGRQFVALAGGGNIFAFGLD